MADVPAEIFDHNTAILGRVGSGKSYAARGIVESWLEAGRRVCIIDPTDVWFGLRANAAGDGAGFPVVVFGGEHADVPIGERSGARIAEIVAGRNLPAIIATAEMTVGERHRFMTEFLGTLFRANKQPLHLVLDEADDVAPQNPLPENRRMLGDVERIVRRGRVRGFRVTMISQRSAVLNKNVLSQASVLVAMRMPAKQDRDAIEGWIKGQADSAEAAEVLGSLSRLRRGEGWIWAPERGILQRQLFPPIATFDSMRTPEHGQVLSEPTGLAEVELGDLRALLDDGASNEAEKSNASVKAQIEAAERRGYERGKLAGKIEIDARAFEILGDLAAQTRQAAESAASRISAAMTEKSAETEEKYASPMQIASVPQHHVEKIALPSTRPTDPSRQSTQANGSLPSSAAKMLAVLSRQIKLTWAQTATLAGLKARGGHFNAGRKALRDHGYVNEDGEGVYASPLGLDAAGGAQPRPSAASEIFTWWHSALPRSAGRVLDHLYKHGKWESKERLAGYLGLAPRGGHWNSALSILRNNALIEVKGDQLRVSADLRDG